MLHELFVEASSGWIATVLGLSNYYTRYFFINIIRVIVVSFSRSIYKRGGELEEAMTSGS